MSLGEKDAVHLAAMLRYLNLASSFIGEMTFDEFSDESHVQTQFAVAMAIAQVGEHVKGLSREFRSDESSVDWREAHEIGWCINTTRWTFVFCTVRL